MSYLDKIDKAALPKHVAIIMDGNGRWAKSRGLTRYAGHRAGADAVRCAVESAPGLGIRALTLYAFSSDNWSRPSREVRLLMGLFQSYLSRETSRCANEGVRIAVIGRRDRLSGQVTGAIERAEAATAAGDQMLLRLAVDYSARDAIVAAACRLAETGVSSRAEMARLIAGTPEDLGLASVDLVIRTGGEQRLSDFLLWESAYAELVFTRTMWPDFSPAHLQRAVAEYSQRERRFGSVPIAMGVDYQVLSS